jgi:hypothetical protein
MDVQAGLGQHLARNSGPSSASRTAAVATVTSGATPCRVPGLQSGAAPSAPDACPRVQTARFGKPGPQAAQDLFVVRNTQGARAAPSKITIRTEFDPISITPTRLSACASGPSKRGTPKGPHSGCSSVCISAALCKARSRSCACHGTCTQPRVNHRQTEWVSSGTSLAPAEPRPDSDGFSMKKRWHENGFSIPLRSGRS